MPPLFKAERVFPKFKKCLLIQRFLANVSIGKCDECWEWKGATTGLYGRFRWKEKDIWLAHVAAYVLFVGSRHGLKVCHSCDNTLCVNPFHLWLGTQKQNVADMFAKGRQHDRIGEFNAAAKLTRKQVELIRLEHLAGESTYKLADTYSVTQPTIHAIVSGKTWR